MKDYMKKTILKIVFVFILFTGALYIKEKLFSNGRSLTVGVQAEAKPEYMQDVPLDEAHFPDERLRKQLGDSVDENRDGILSRVEREKIYYLKVGFFSSLTRGWYSDMKYMEVGYDQDDHIVYEKNKYVLELRYEYQEGISKFGKLADPEKTLDLKGIEYFFNIQEARIHKYELLTGSFKNNVNLKKIWVECSALGDKSYVTVQDDFPVSQLTYMHLENIAADTLDVRGMADLQVMRVILPDGSSRRLPALDLSKNTKLKELELGNIMPGRLDLRKNRKLESVKVYSGERKTGQKYGGVLRVDDYDEEYTEYEWFQYYIPKQNQTCRVTFAKKNKIKTFHYFTGDKKIDLTRLTKLEDFQSLKATKAKVKSDWVRRTFTKKKWGCAVVKSGKFMKKVKAAKKKKYTLI